MAQTTSFEKNFVRKPFKAIKQAILLALLVGGLFLFSGQVLGAVSYSREPSGYTIENPVSFEVSIDDFNEICEESWTWWSLYIYSEYEEPEIEIFSDLVASTTLSHTFIETLPLGIYTEIKSACCGIDEEELLECEDIDTFEYRAWYEGGIFEVVEPLFFLFTVDDLASTTAYISDILISMGGLLFLAIGLHLAFYVIRKVLAIFPM